MDRIPYCYTIQNKINGKIYYGVSYRKGCDPKDIGKTYFSSSKIVKEEIEKYGIENFSFKIRKIFDNAEKAKLWEHKILNRVDARNNPKFYNQSNNADGFYTKDKLTIEHRRKISEGNKGKIVSSETRKKMSESQTGYKQSEEHIRNRVLKNTGKRRPKIAIEATAKANTGRKNTEEVKSKMSEARKGIGIGVKRNMEAVLQSAKTRRLKRIFFITYEDGSEFVTNAQFVYEKLGYVPRIRCRFLIIDGIRYETVKSRARYDGEPT